MASLSMEAWKTNHLLLTEKLVLFIGKTPGVTLDVLEARALGHGVPMRVFDQAIQNLHRLKGVKRTTSGDTVKYSLQEIKEKPSDIIDTGVPYPRPPLCASCNGENCALCFPFFDESRDTRTAIRARWAMEKEERLAVFNKRSSSKPAWVR